MRQNSRLMRALYSFMQGRYGMDQLGRCTSCVSLGLMVAALLLRGAARGIPGSVLAYAAVALLLWGYFRLLSRNIARRQEENLRYLRLTQTLRSRLRLRRERFRQRRDYAFFRCPGCHQTVRVPRGKGKLRITCRRCGYTFEKKT